MSDWPCDDVAPEYQCCHDAWLRHKARAGPILGHGGGGLANENPIQNRPIKACNQGLQSRLGVSFGRNFEEHFLPAPIRRRIFCLNSSQSMVPKSGDRFSKKIMLNRNLKRDGDST
jgi:hypothetical protein